MDMIPLLEFINVFYRYPGQQEFALKDVTVSLPPGEKIIILGRNGAGKTTLFLHCNGLYQPHSGEIRFAGQSITKKYLTHLRQKVGLLFQNPDEQLFSASVFQDISFGPLNLGLDEAEVWERVREVASLCEIISLLERPTHALSGGEKARVALAGVLAMEPDLLIADEPLASLDPWIRQQVMAIFEKIHAQGKTILLASHDLSMTKNWATFLIFMAEGEVIFSGPPDQLLNDEALMIKTGLAQIW